MLSLQMLNPWRNAVRDTAKANELSLDEEIKLGPVLMIREVKQSGHGFRKERLTSRKWLEYSRSADKVFCLPLSKSNPCIQASFSEAFRKRHQQEKEIQENRKYVGKLGNKLILELGSMLLEKLGNKRALDISARMRELARLVLQLRTDKTMERRDLNAFLSGKKL